MRRREARGSKVQERIAVHFAWLREEVSALEGDFDTAVKDSLAWRANEALLRLVRRVGSTTARTMIAESPKLGKIDRSRSAALVGVAPTRYETDPD